MTSINSNNRRYQLGDIVHYQEDSTLGTIVGVTRWLEGFTPQTDYRVLCGETIYEARAESLRPAAIPSESRRAPATKSTPSAMNSPD